MKTVLFLLVSATAYASTVTIDLNNPAVLSASCTDMRPVPANDCQVDFSQPDSSELISTGYGSNVSYQEFQSFMVSSSFDLAAQTGVSLSADASYTASGTNCNAAGECGTPKGNPTDFVGEFSGSVELLDASNSVVLNLPFSGSGTGTTDQLGGGAWMGNFSLSDLVFGSTTLPAGNYTVLENFYADNNAGGDSSGAGTIDLTITDPVAAVPEPVAVPTLLVLGIVLAWNHNRRRILRP